VNPFAINVNASSSRGDNGDGTGDGTGETDEAGGDEAAGPPLNCDCRISANWDDNANPPAATVRTADTNISGSANFVTYPLAPARMAPNTSTGRAEADITNTFSTVRKCATTGRHGSSLL
jgi:hypothetical protein